MQREAVFIGNKTPTQGFAVKQAEGIAVPRLDRRPSEVPTSLLHRLQD